MLYTYIYRYRIKCVSALIIKVNSGTIKTTLNGFALKNQLDDLLLK
jgi:hypothetical protein